MVKKPTYEELGQRVKTLEKEAKKHRQAEEERDRILTLSQDLICIAGMDGFFKFVNPAWQDILGYTLEELLSRPFLDFIHPDDHGKNEEEVKKLSEGQLTIDFENRYIHKDGSLKVINWRATPIPGEKIMYCIGRDITAQKETEAELKRHQDNLENLVLERAKKLDSTNKKLEQEIYERKQAEEDLRKSEEKFRSLVELTSDWIWEVDKEGTYTYVSPKIEDLLGYNPKDLIGKTPFDFMPLEERDRIAGIFKKIVTSGEAIKVLENINIHKSGREMVLETSGEPILDSSGNLIGYRGIDRDITERKEIEKELQQSELMHKTLVNNIPGMVYRAYPDWSAEVISGSMEVCGYSSTELNSKKDNWLSIIHPDDKEGVFKEGSELLNTSRSITQKYRIISKDGSTRWVEDRKISIFSEKGEFLLIDGIVFDITDQVKVEENLKKSEGTARALLDASMESAFLIDTHGTYVDMNEVTARRLGKCKKDLLGMNFIDSMPLKVAATRKAIMDKVIKNREPIRFEDELSGFIFDNNIYPIIDSEGNVERIAIFSRDITVRKEMEEKLLKEKEKLEESISEIKRLSGLLPICASCKKIRDDKGYWSQIETYISEHSEADFSHSICPECSKKLYPDLDV